MAAVLPAPSHAPPPRRRSAPRAGPCAGRDGALGACRSLRAARAYGDFASLTAVCERIDRRLTDRRVLESLARVGARAAFGHPAQILAGLDDAMSAVGGLRFGGVIPPGIEVDHGIGGGEV